MSVSLVLLDAKSLGSCPVAEQACRRRRRTVIVVDPDAPVRLMPVGGRVGVSSDEPHFASVVCRSLSRPASVG